ncbi:MAG: hypothetical protein HKN70_01810 [Gammaproteobacteria bacterium]|nr:hypothetical protein [Gammaproteobacteria bacterium]
MTFIESVRLFHVIAGFTGLAVFWIPVFTRKGGINHVRFGKMFKWCAYVVLALAAVSVGYHLIDYWWQGLRPWSEPNAFGFLIFLGYLALVTFISVHHAIGVLVTKKNPDSLRTPLRVALAYLSMLATVIVVAFALLFNPDSKIILLALSPLGILGGIGTLRYLNGKRISRHAWLYEHLGGMLGAGIAFHTAFAVFGFNQMFDFSLPGNLRILPWILPAAIGIPAISLWTRSYKKKFGDTGATA